MQLETDKVYDILVGTVNGEWPLYTFEAEASAIFWLEQGDDYARERKHVFRAQLSVHAEQKVVREKAYLLGTDEMGEEDPDGEEG